MMTARHECHLAWCAAADDAVRRELAQSLLLLVDAAECHVRRLLDLLSPAIELLQRQSFEALAFQHRELCRLPRPLLLLAMAPGTRERVGVWVRKWTHPN